MEQWKSYLRLTESMLALAEGKQWQELDDVCEARRRIQEKLRSAHPEASEIEPLSQCLEKCIALNQKIATLVGGAREETAASLQRIQFGGQAVAAYQNAKELVRAANE